MPTRERAICLRSTDYSETSQVLSFLTRGSGVVRVIAKGSKRPKSKSGGAVDLLSEGELVFADSRREALGTLIEFSETVSRAPLRGDVRRLYTGLYAIELVSQMLAESDPHPEVFDLLHNTLIRLGSPDAPTAAVLAFFQWRLLQHVGLLGDLQTCVSCGADVISAAPNSRRDVYFSSQQGGLLCRDCESAAPEKYRLDGVALAGLTALQAVQRSTPPRPRIALPDNQAHAVNRLLDYHASQLLHKPLKLARHAIPPPERSTKRAQD
jgi:DNA repair protein RecO (recombination protein O)